MADEEASGGKDVGVGWMRARRGGRMDGRKADVVAVEAMSAVTFWTGGVLGTASSSGSSSASILSSFSSSSASFSSAATGSGSGSVAQTPVRISRASCTLRSRASMRSSARSFGDL